MTRRGKPEGWVELLASVLANVPKLTDPACVGKAELFDAANGSHDDIEKAISLCRQCKCLTACADWAGRQRQLTGVQLTGVVAARYHTPNRYDREHDDEHNDGEAEQ